MKTSLKILLFLSFSLIFLCKTNYAQVEIDTVYLFPDTTTFLNYGAIYTGNVGNAAVRFFVPDGWESYQIDKILVLVPDSTLMGPNIYNYTISLGSEPLDSVLFESDPITAQNYFPVWWEINIEPDIQISQTNNFFISGSIPMWICISYDLDSLIMNEFLLISNSELRWHEGVNIYYALKAVVKNTTTGINDEAHSEFSFNLSQNYPNPFNSRTTIEYMLNEYSPIKIELYNIFGEKVSDLYEGNREAGNFRLVFEAKDLTSGVYFYRMYSPTRSLVRKMIYLK